MERKKVAIIVITIVFMVVLFGAVSYAFFNITGISEEQEVQLETGTMELTFSDNDIGISERLAFDESIVKKFAIQNTGTVDSSLSIRWDDLVNTYTEGSLTYVLEYSNSETGTYSTLIEKTNVPVSVTSSIKTLAKKVTVPAGETYYYKLTVKLEYLDDVDQTDDFDALFHTKFSVDQPVVESTDEEGGDGATTFGWMQNAVTDVTNGQVPSNIINLAPSFEDAATGYEGLYSMEDNYGTSYYFRGAAEDNYVKFAGFYWRIIRINGDGSVRMIYDGTSAHENGEASNDRVTVNGLFQTSIYGNSAFGYMYSVGGSPANVQTNTDSSAVKNSLEAWYSTNIAAPGLSDYVADAIFCNDRTITSGSGGSNVNTYYSAYNRITTTRTPSFICPESTLVSSNNNWFTAEATAENLGNGALTFPIGLITADEAIAAGAPLNSALTLNTNFYLYKGVGYWTMSPARYFDNGAYMYVVGPNGKVADVAMNSTDRYGFAPVINIKAEHAKNFIGVGSATDPYRIAE